MLTSPDTVLADAIDRHNARDDLRAIARDVGEAVAEFVTAVREGAQITDEDALVSLAHRWLEKALPDADLVAQLDAVTGSDDDADGAA